MVRKLLTSAVVLGLFVGISFAEEIRAVITKVDGSSITFAENKGKGQRGDSKTMSAADNVKVLKGKYNQDTKKLEAGDPLEGGLRNAALSNIGADGVRATLITTGDKITEIRVGGGRKKTN